VTAADQEVRPSRQLVVSERLRVRRHQLGLTQKQVVTRLRRLGVESTNKALSSLEHGSGLDVGRLPELAQALDCTVTWLLGLTQDPHRWDPDGPAGSPVAAPDDRASARDRPAAAPRRTRPEGRWILGPLSEEV
jgi:transcriptional regulator with XRE-family HTH domain